MFYICAHPPESAKHHNYKGIREQVRACVRVTVYNPLTEFRRESKLKASGTSGLFGNLASYSSALGNTSSTLGHDIPPYGRQKSQHRNKLTLNEGGIHM